jgi:mRNA interferase HigB
MTTISDELTVPLFRAHHREAHDCEHEAAWWKASPISSWRSRSARGDAGGRENGRSSRMAAWCSILRATSIRLVVWINYPYRVVYIRFIGTHRQYDMIDAQKV